MISSENKLATISYSFFQNTLSNICFSVKSLAASLSQFQPISTNSNSDANRLLHATQEERLIPEVRCRTPADAAMSEIGHSVVLVDMGEANLQRRCGSDRQQQNGSGSNVEPTAQAQ